MQRRRSARLNEVAEAVGVSTMTVSRALRGVEGVSEDRRKEIWNAALRIGYIPDASAQALAGKRSNLVGIAVPTLFNDVFADILAGMRDRLKHEGLTTVIDTTDYDPALERNWVERLLAWRPSGVVLTGADHGPGVKTLLRRLKIPTLELWDAAEDPIDVSVGIDHFAAGQLIGSILKKKGHQKAGFVGAPHGLDPRAEQRLSGIEKSIGRKIHVERMEGVNAFVAGHDGVERILALPSSEKPDVIAFLNDHYAFGGLMACQKHGVKVPEHMGLIGFNALPITSVLPVKLSTLATPRRQMGITGAQMLIARIKGARVQRRTVLECAMIKGETL